MTKQQLVVLYAVSIIAVMAAFFLKPITQDQNYHQFSDSVTLFSVPNFWNVISNVPFIIIGILGLVKIVSIKDFSLKTNYIWFFTGILLTGFGSGYYHYNPDNTTLIWDRLPMTISFMSFLSVIIGEFINASAGKRLLYPMLITGLLSIAYWILTDDLRFYALIQFLPILVILLILFLSKKEQRYKKYFWLIIVSYAVAKFLEGYDTAVYQITNEMISGHSLKHLAAAFGPFLFYKFADRKFKPEH
ncbi:ceramidase [Flavobacterium amniphilum]|uniref:ceramidase domain-containing protein n=1 Tax=Flavobacterium amniphilum TaxID=1834035 RepID=UPI00202A19C4|nr:ceramidase domain-containing protein [Flavobacterium amniphilum]MCL9804172.1 ceramidase [Flavobacterium amniphilum]